MVAAKRASRAARSTNRRQYKRPPITEAVCALYFEPTDDWNVMNPALIYDKIKGEYSGKPREQKLINIDPTSRNIQLGQAPAMAVNEITRTQFVTADEKKVVGVYKDNLSISVLKPYPGWEVFRPAIETGLKAYRAVVKPTGIRKLGMRYINQIELDGQLAEILACFSAAPPVLDAASQVENFTTRYEYLSKNDPTKVAVGFARLIAPAGRVAALLDIDLTWESAGEPLSIDQTMAKVDEMRARERVIFESLITDRARELFDA